ncbi:MAG: aspartate ammonia-lyase, partial [Clostridia bacterium]|nr:aspartate ammonia-lyase [Clostridia bacterium]
VGIVTAICPYIGYKKAAEIAKEALKKNISVKDLILKKGLMDENLLNQALDPLKMTEPEK